MLAGRKVLSVVELSVLVCGWIIMFDALCRLAVVFSELYESWIVNKATRPVDPDIK